jgi:hypothetical protein
MIAKHRTANALDFGSGLRPLAPRRLLIRAKPRERRLRQPRIARRHFAYQFEKERQRTWRSFGSAFMLRRTMLR